MKIAQDLTSTARCDLDLQNLIRSYVWAGEYSLSVLSKLFKAFMRRRDNNNICQDKQMRWTDSQRKTTFADTAGRQRHNKTAFTAD